MATLDLHAMTIPPSVKSDWEKRLPDLSGKWTHWRLSGDGQVIALVPVEKLLDALRIVAENCARYTSIKCSRASVDAADSCADVEEAVFEISNIRNDKRLQGHISSLSGGNET